MIRKSFIITTLGAAAFEVTSFASQNPNVGGATDNLPTGTVDKLSKPENKKNLAATLTYHLLPGKVTAKELLEKRGDSRNRSGADALTRSITQDGAVGFA